MGQVLGRCPVRRKVQQGPVVVPLQGVLEGHEHVEAGQPRLLGLFLELLDSAGAALGVAWRLAEEPSDLRLPPVQLIDCEGDAGLLGADAALPEHLESGFPTEISVAKWAILPRKFGPILSRSFFKFVREHFPKGVRAEISRCLEKHAPKSAQTCL